MLKISLFFRKHYSIKAYRELEEFLHEFLTSPLKGVEWPVSRFYRFTPTQVKVKVKVKRTP
jgi:hypothetical protein